MAYKCTESSPESSPKSPYKCSTNTRRPLLNYLANILLITLLNRLLNILPITLLNRLLNVLLIILNRLLNILLIALNRLLNILLIVLNRLPNRLVNILLVILPSKEARNIGLLAKTSNKTTSYSRLVSIKAYYYYRITVILLLFVQTQSLQYYKGFLLQYTRLNKLLFINLIITLITLGIYSSNRLQYIIFFVLNLFVYRVQELVYTYSGFNIVLRGKLLDYSLYLILVLLLFIGLVILAISFYLYPYLRGKSISQYTSLNLVGFNYSRYNLILSGNTLAYSLQDIYRPIGIILQIYLVYYILKPFTAIIRLLRFNNTLI